MRGIVIILLLVIVSGSASAQFYDKMFFVGWNFNTPLVNKEFVGKPSSRGARIGYRELLREQLAFGIDLTWATYDDYVPRQTYNNTNSTITTDFTNYANNYGALLTADYYFRVEKKVMPYAGFGAGLAYNNYKVYYNVYSSGDNAFGFLMRPQAGVWMKFNERKNWALNAGVHLDFSTAKSSDTGYNTFMNAGFELGLVFLDW
jgi:opacity protein-like surface antigen